MRIYIRSLPIVYLFFYTILYLIMMTASVYSVSFIESSTDLIEISYNAQNDESSEDEEDKAQIIRRENATSIKSKIVGSEVENNNLNLPLSIMVCNDFKSYQLAVNQITPFDDEKITIEMKFPLNILNSGDKKDSAEDSASINEFLLIDPLKINQFEKIFFTYDNPEYSLQTFDFLFDVKASEEVEPGSYSSIIKFYLYQEGIIISEVEITINIIIKEYFIMEIFFIDSENAWFDFGYISREITRIDKNIEIDIRTNMERPFRIIQKRGETMKSSLTDIEFYLKDILFEINNKDIQGKAYHDKIKSLEIEDDVIYESDSIGSSDTIPIVYSLQNHGNFKAGDYASTLSFYIEAFDKSDVFSEVKITFDFLVKIEKYFFFNVYPENNSSILDFTPRMLDASQGIKILKVDVFSNTGKQYVFSHSLPSELITVNGGIIDNKNLSFILVDEEGGALPLEDERAINNTEQTIYESNYLGDSDVFYIKYIMHFDKEQISGFYRSDIQFSLSDD